MPTPYVTTERPLRAILSDYATYKQAMEQAAEQIRQETAGGRVNFRVIEEAGNEELAALTPSEKEYRAAVRAAWALDGEVRGKIDYDTLSTLSTEEAAAALITLTPVEIEGEARALAARIQSAPELLERVRLNALSCERAMLDTLYRQSTLWLPTGYRQPGQESIPLSYLHELACHANRLTIAMRAFEILGADWDAFPTGPQNVSTVLMNLATLDRRRGGKTLEESVTEVKAFACGRA